MSDAGTDQKGDAEGCRFFRSVGAPCEPRLLSHVRGEHRFYLEADGRVRVCDDSGSGGYYLAAARFRVNKAGGVDVPITKGAVLYWTPEPAEGALHLLGALAHIGYYPGVDTSRIEALIGVLSFAGSP